MVRMDFLWVMLRQKQLNRRHCTKEIKHKQENNKDLRSVFTINTKEGSVVFF
jgi:hypothetical protein